MLSRLRWKPPWPHLAAYEERLIADKSRICNEIQERDQVTPIFQQEQNPELSSRPQKQSRGEGSPLKQPAQGSPWSYKGAKTPYLQGRHGVGDWFERPWPETLFSTRYKILMLTG
jgi:hypothetical protein